MQVTELESKGLKRSYRVVVEAARINTQTEAELRAAGKNVRMAGFRPGHVPLKVLQQRFGKSVQADVLRQVLNRTSNEVITQKKIRPALTPQVNVEDYKDDGDLTYTMVVELFPDVAEVDFAKLSLDRKIVDISEQDIDDAAARIAERSPKYAEKPEGSKAESGDVVTIDFKGSIGGKLFDGGSADNFQLALGSGQFIPGFEEQLIGAKKGDERVVKVAFPKDYGMPKLAGKDAEFAVTIHAISTPETPVADEEFAKARGFADLAAFREAVRTQISKEFEGIVRNDLKKQLFDILENEYAFDLPEGMVDMEFNTIWQRLEEAKKEGDESLAGKTEDELKKEYREIAQRRVRLGIALADVGNRNKIQIARDELTRAVMQQASMFPGQEQKVLEFYRKNPERVDDLRGPILEEKAVDFILTKVTFNDKKTTIAELTAGDDDEKAEKKPAKKASKKKKDDANK